MSAGVLPVPGSKLGPCVEPCEHVDCAETRRMAATLCMCGGEIGYETRFYQRLSGLAHAACLEAEIEKRRVEGGAKLGALSTATVETAHGTRLRVEAFPTRCVMLDLRVAGADPFGQRIELLTPEEARLLGWALVAAGDAAIAFAHDERSRAEGGAK